MWGEEEDVPSLQKKQSIKYQVSIERSVNNESLSKEKKLAVPSSSSSPPRKLPVQMKSENQTRVIGDYVHVRKTSLGTSQSNYKEVSLSSTFVSQVTIGSKIEIQKPSPPRLTERSMAQVAMLLRPSSAPLVLGGPRPIIFVVSKVQIAPLLARSMSAIGRFSLPLAFHILLLLPQEHFHFLFFLTRFHFFFFLTSVSICSSSSPALEFLLLLLHPTLQFPLGVHLASLFGFPMAPWSSFPCAFLVFFFRGIAICSDVELHALRRHLQIMVRTRGLGRALGRVSGRGLGREDRDDSDDAPQRRRPTASAHRQRVPVTIADAELVVLVVEADVAAIEADVATAEAEVVVDESMVEADIHDIGADIAANASAQAAADEPEGFLGGSTDPSVLTEYAEDVAANECLELKLSFHGRKVHNLGRLVPAIEGLVAGTRLSPLIACSVDNDDRGLLSSFVEWWNWETSSFHLLVGEVMITLDDVSSLLHLPVVGDLHTFQPLHVDEARQPGLRPNTVVDRTYACLGYAICISTDVRLYIRQLQLVRIFSIFWVALIFANKSVTHVHVVFLDALCDLSQTGRYAWGVAALVHMYDHLNDACISTSRQLAVAECNADPDYDKDSPHAYRWIATKKTMKNISTGTIPDVCWIPYGEHQRVWEFHLISCYSGQLRWGPVVVSYRPERVMWQFGYIQSIPAPPVDSWVSFDEIDDMWMHYSDHLVPAGETCIVPGHCAPDYIDWFFHISHPFMTATQPSNPLPNAPAMQPRHVPQVPEPAAPSTSARSDVDKLRHTVEACDSISERLERHLNLGVVTLGTSTHEVIEECLGIARSITED
ncbi:hypothetical protein HKD37_15G043719 [Glycine soja]